MTRGPETSTWYVQGKGLISDQVPNILQAHANLGLIHYAGHHLQEYPKNVADGSLPPGAVTIRKKDIFIAPITPSLDTVAAMEEYLVELRAATNLPRQLSEVSGRRKNIQGKMIYQESVGVTLLGRATTVDIYHDARVSLGTVFTDMIVQPDPPFDPHIEHDAQVYFLYDRTDIRVSRTPELADKGLKDALKTHPLL